MWQPAAASLLLLTWDLLTSSSLFKGQSSDVGTLEWMAPELHNLQEYVAAPTPRCTMPCCVAATWLHHAETAPHAAIVIYCCIMMRPSYYTTVHPYDPPLISTAPHRTAPHRTALL